MMKITIKTKNLETSESLNSFVEKKFSLLEKIVKSSEEIIVEIEKETNHHRKGDIYRVKAQVAFNKKNIVSDEVADDLFVAIVQAKDELKNEIEKYKAKKIDKVRRKQVKAKEKNRIE